MYSGEQDPVILFVFREHVSHDEYFSNLPLTIQERAASIRVTVAVYCQDDTHERPVIADKQTGKSQLCCPARRHVINNSLLSSRGRGLYSPKRYTLVRLWNTERTAGQVCSADRPVLPLTGKRTLRIA